MHTSAIGGDGLPDGALIDRISNSNFDPRIGRPGHAERLGPGCLYAISQDRLAMADAARKVTGFLRDHPGLAQMPLGVVAGQLTVASARLGTGAAIDSEVTKLALRIAKFISKHSRLAQSEFGSAILDLAQAFQPLNANTCSDEAVALVEETDLSVSSDRIMAA
jgi:hypothetical protein